MDAVEIGLSIIILINIAVGGICVFRYYQYNKSLANLDNDIIHDETKLESDYYLSDEDIERLKGSK